MNIKNYSFTPGKRLNEYTYIRYRIDSNTETEEKIYCNNDNTFHELLDIWNRSYKWNKFYSKDIKIKGYSVELKKSNIWEVVFSSTERQEIREHLLREGYECRRVRVKTVSIDNEEGFIYNISLLLGNYE